MPKPRAPSAATLVERRTAATRTAIAANIRGRREALGLSQEALAEAAELSAIYVATLEQARETSNPTLKALVAIATALDCELRDLAEPAELEPRSAGRPSRAPAELAANRAGAGKPGKSSVKRRRSS